jgi:hypothetical protein
MWESRRMKIWHKELAVIVFLLLLILFISMLSGTANVAN